MKKLFSCILAILILAVSIIPGFAENEGVAPVSENVSLSVSASSTSVSVGDTITVTVGVSGGLSMINLNIKYNSEYLAYSSYSSGSAFSSHEFSPSTGSLTFLGFDGAGGSIVTVTFKVLKVSNGSEGKISVSASGSDVEGNKVSVSGNSVTVKCAHKDLETVVSQPSTCSVPGRSESKCKNCGATGLNVTEIPTIPHSYSEWTIVTMPTEFTPGEQKRVCTVCQHIDSKKININGQETEEPGTSTEIEIPSYPYYEEEPETNAPQVNPNSNGNYRPEQKDDEEKNEKKGLAALFASSSEVSDSDKAAVIVIILAVIIVVVLAIYLLLLKQRKKG